MSGKSSEGVIVKIQRINGEQVIDIPPEFDLGTDDVTLEYDGERIIMTARSATDDSIEGQSDA